MASPVGGYREKHWKGEAAGNFTGQVKPVVYVRDVEAGMPFCRDALGFEFRGYFEADGEVHSAEMGPGPLKFGLHNPTNPEQQTWVGHQLIYFRVRDLKEQRARVLSHQGPAGEITGTDWMDMLIVRDPDGHQIVVASHAR